MLRVLDARGVAVSPEQKARVLACADLTILDRWIDQAVRVTAAAELFID